MKSIWSILYEIFNVAFIQLAFLLCFLHILRGKAVQLSCTQGFLYGSACS